MITCLELNNKGVVMKALRNTFVATNDMLKSSVANVQTQFIIRIRRKYNIRIHISNVSCGIFYVDNETAQRMGMDSPPENTQVSKISNNMIYNYPENYAKRQEVLMSKYKPPSLDDKIVGNGGKSSCGDFIGELPCILFLNDPPSFQFDSISFEMLFGVTLIGEEQSFERSAENIVTGVESILFIPEDYFKH